MSKTITSSKMKTRNRIIAAARDLAAERGPRHISIAEVAVRAGLSKGGVLYHFHTKAEMLAAIVSFHVEKTAERIEHHMPEAGQNRLAQALIAAHRDERQEPTPASSGIFAVLAEHSNLLDPVRRHQQTILDTLQRESNDPELAMIVLLALEGMRAFSLFEFDVLAPETEETLLDRMNDLLTSASIPTCDDLSGT
ncbi:hypothetical protein A9Q95_07565 [Rhodobacterales bacterium 59_46_T64]|nr:hypothetical protein A9Q95_07565 [Rhodobacterales bacterium 59_46_T64]